MGYGETLDALTNGVLDSHHSGGPYFSGKEPALALIGDLNGGFENPCQMQLWFEYGRGPRAGARDLPAVQRLLRGPGLVGRRVRPRQETAPEPGRLQRRGWFGILFNINMQVAYLSPPFGGACFFLKGVAPPDVTMEEIFASCWPWMGLQLIGLALVMMFPELALWLPRAAR